MKILRVIVLGSIVGLSACTVSDRQMTTPETDSAGTMKLATDSNIITAAIDSTNSQESSTWKGTYEGVLPCNDCAGLIIKIILHADSSYIATAKHLIPKEKKEDTWSGKFSWINDSIIQLEGVRAIAPKYLIAENKIIQLDVNGKQVAGEKADKYILTRTDF